MKKEKALLIFICLLISMYALMPFYTLQEWHANLYNQVPVPLLVTGIVFLIVSAVGCVFMLFQKNRKAAVLWATLGTLTLGSLVVLPLALRYTLKYGDPITHHGYIRDILSTGELPTHLMYPALHILTAAVSMVAKVPVTISYPAVAVAVVSTLIIVMGIIAREIETPVAPAILLAPLSFGTNLTPSAMAYAISFTLCVYFLIKIAYRPHSKILVREYAAGFGVILVTVWFTHIIVAGIVALCLGLTVVLINFVDTNHFDLSISSQSVHLSLLFLLFGFAGFLWMAHTWLFRRAVILPIKYLGLHSDLRAAHLSGDKIAGTLLSEMGLSLIDVAWLAVRRFGDWGIILALTGLSIFFWVRGSQRIPAFIPIVAVGAIIWAVIELTIGIIPSISVFRALRPAVYLSPVLASVAIANLIRLSRNQLQHSTRLLCMALVTTTLVVGLLIGGVNAFNSPMIMDKNQYVMESDIEGMNWLYEEKSKEIKTVNLWRSNDRYMDYLMRPDEKRERKKELKYTVETNEYRPPSHFGYDNNATFGAAIGCHYYVHGIRGEYTYTEVWNSLYQIEERDIAQLDTDYSIQRVYTNGKTSIAQVGC